MKLNKIFFLLILTIPFFNYAQYLGGDGRGDFSIIMTNVPLPVEVVASSLPTKVELEQNYPNPFNPSTKIKFTLTPSLFLGERVSEGRVEVTLKIYDVLGNEIATLVNEEKPAGTYEVNFTTEGLPSGLYFYSLTVVGFSETKKMVLIK